VVHKIKERSVGVFFCPFIDPQIDALLTRAAPPRFCPFGFCGKFIRAPKSDFVVDVIEDFIQVSRKLANAGEMDISLCDFGTKKERQLKLLETD
jgi:hypothetical protein